MRKTSIKKIDRKFFEQNMDIINTELYDNKEKILIDLTK